MMPSPIKNKICEYCGSQWKTRSIAARTCSPKCRARLREIEYGKTRGKSKREYPREIVELVCGMYQDGMTVSEIGQVAPKGYRVQTILERYLPNRRAAAKRHQTGDLNHMWKGADAGYQAAHLRISEKYGPATNYKCVGCSEQAEEWSFNNECSEQIVRDKKPPYCLHREHYKPRCVKCHRNFDRKERDAHV